MTLVRLKQRGQITLPKSARERLNLKEGDLLRLSADGSSSSRSGRANPSPSGSTLSIWTGWPASSPWAATRRKMRSGTRIKVCLDTSYLVALYDAADLFHARARAIGDALKDQGAQSVYLDCVVNEVLNVLARRVRERAKGVSPERIHPGTGRCGDSQGHYHLDIPGGP